MRSRERFGYLLLAPALLVMGAFLLGPIAAAFVTSLHVDTPFAPRRFVGLENYALLLEDEAALGSLEFTLLFVVVSVALEVAGGLVVALVLDRWRRGQGLVRAAVLLPWAMPTVVAAVMWKYIFNDQYGLVNALMYGDALERYQAWLAHPLGARAAIILADVWKSTSFAALLILAGLQAVPRELLEAARADGAGPLRRLLWVRLPLIRPAILVAVLFRTIDALRVFDLVYVMTRGAPAGATDVLQFYGYQKMFPEQQFGYGAAVSVCVFLLALGLSLLAMRLVGTRSWAR
ncbi:MAG: ABC transporter permease [Planctomycetota bacterium]|nr:MAG: ABC transporter permease [Planctomycetota bacterium]